MVTICGLSDKQLSTRLIKSLLKLHQIFYLSVTNCSTISFSCTETIQQMSLFLWRHVLWFM